MHQNSEKQRSRERVMSRVLLLFAKKLHREKENQERERTRAQDIHSLASLFSIHIFIGM